KISELKGYGNVVRNLVTVGVIVTWGVITLAAIFILDLGLSMSLLLGAVLVVTGPTVIIPLLRSVRPKGHIGSILKWEGIIIDPIGAMLAVLVFEGIIAGGLKEAGSLAAIGIIKTIIVGGFIGIAAAWIMVQLLRRYWIPDYLQNPVMLMAVVTAFILSGHFQAESGLLAVTLMGVYLANQKLVTVKHIVEFKENLSVLLIAGLFIILAARLTIAELSYIDFSGILFLAVLVVIARPLSVFASTISSGLSMTERFFLMCMAPRGIVAAAIASIFSLRLAELGYVEAELLVPLTFMVIIGTVALYGLGAGPIAKRLKLSSPNPQGLLIAGAHYWARAIAKVVKDEGFEVMLTDSNWANITKARLAGLPVYFGSVLSEQLHAKTDLVGIGRLLAMTNNDNVNSLAAIRFVDVFGRMEVYQLSPFDEKRLSEELKGRLLFGEGRTYSQLDKLFYQGGVVKANTLTEEFGFDELTELYGGYIVPLFVVEDGKTLKV
ncbi:MAG: cation:proton antiporter, partial [Deltaproteobacteria bacterium]|nr:cation:proton antiporter [Deltaproteobacteria bacterium]